MLRSILRTIGTLTILAAMLSLAGCLEPAAPATPPTPDTAARFLGRTTFGATSADIDHLVQVGYEAWLSEQFDQPSIDTHYDYVDRGGPVDCTLCPASNLAATVESFWYQAIEGKDQLRQRVALAWLELFVTSAATDSTLELEPLALASYLDTLSKHAFDNYRDLLEAVTLSPTMGQYLSHRQNDKEDPATGRLPDENYAREVMQLFTIGKWQLNSDGTRTKDANGNDIPTYTQQDVMGLAKVLTGWSWGGPDTSEARWVGGPVNYAMVHTWELPMQPYDQHHSTSEQAIVGGVVIPAGTNARDSLKTALDTLFNHPNAGPFVATHLIKRLVTSNPSPAYVGRVASVFEANKQGVRGDMRAVIRAVLFDPEVWDGSHDSDPNWGKAREPIVKVAQLVRAFQCKSTKGTYQLGALQSADYDVGQPPLMSNSVFNFFQPDHAPQGPIADAGLVAPEFQITNNSTMMGYLNIVHRLLDYGLYTDANSLKCDLTSLKAAAQDPASLSSALSSRLMGKPLSAESSALLRQTLGTIAVDSSGTNYDNRVKAGIMMIMASPEYNIQQ